MDPIHFDLLEHGPRIKGIVSQLAFNDWKFFVHIPDSTTAVRHLGDKPYLQVMVDGVDNVTGEPMSWKGRKWQLSFHMTETEIVRTAFKAVMTAVEHEVCEQFKYMGVAPFDPHFKIEHLVKLAEMLDLDARK